MGIPTRGRASDARPACIHRSRFRSREKNYKDDENSNLQRRRDVCPSPCRHIYRSRSRSPCPDSRNRSRSSGPDSRNRSRSPSPGPVSGHRWGRHIDYRHWPARKHDWPSPRRHTSGRGRSQSSAEQRGYGHGAEGPTPYHSRDSTCPRISHNHGSFPPSSLAGRGRSRSEYCSRRPTFRYGKWNRSHLPYPSWETVRSRADAVAPPRRQRSGCSPCSVESGECVNSGRRDPEMSGSDDCSRREDSSLSTPKYKDRYRSPSSVKYKASTVFVGNLPPQRA